VTIDFKSNKAITLVELIIAIGLITLIITLGYMFYFTGVRAFDRNVDRADIQQNVRHSMSFITKRLLNADNESVTVPSTNELIIGDHRFRLDKTRMTLQVNQNHPISTTFNPLAEGIAAFEVTRTGRVITVAITGGAAQESDLFTLSTQVLMRR